MEEKNENAIEIIYKTFDLISHTTKQLENLEYQLKLLNNRFTKLEKLVQEGIASEASVPQTAISRPGKAVAVSSAPIVSPQQQQQSQITQERRKPDRLVLGKIKVFAHLLNQKKEPAKGAEIDIFNSAGELIKIKNADDMGYWEVKLPPGAYNAEMRLKGFQPAKISFVLTEDMTEFQVRP